MKSRSIGLVVSACALTGCATITRGTHEVFVVETEPSNARVQLSTGLTCDATPCSLRIDRKGSFAVTISKAGYKTTTYNVATQVAGGGAAGMAGNVLVGGIIGIGIDATSGATLEHKPNPLKVNLEQEVLVASVTPPADLVAAAANASTAPSTKPIAAPAAPLQSMPTNAAPPAALKEETTAIAPAAIPASVATKAQTP